MSSAIGTFRGMFKQDKSEPSANSRRDFLKQFSVVAAAGGAAVATAKIQTNQFTTESLKKISEELKQIKQLGQHQHAKLNQQVQQLDKRTQLLLRILLIYLGVQAVGYLFALLSTGVGVSSAIASAATTGVKVASKAIV